MKVSEKDSKTLFKNWPQKYENASLWMDKPRVLRFFQLDSLLAEEILALDESQSIFVKSSRLWTILPSKHFSPRGI